MEKIRINANNSFRTLIFSLLLCITMFFPISVKNASADTVEGETLHSLETVIQNTMFLSYRKCDITSKYKRAMFVCYYVPNSVYESEYTYGCVVFPKDYGDTYDIKSDYLKKAAELNVTIMAVDATVWLDAPDGKIFKFGMAEILDQNVDREFCFVFYVKDSEGNIEYATPKFAAYNTLDSKDYTNAELIEMVDVKLETENSFKTILDKLTELVNSIWKYVVLAMAGVVVVWGAFIGIRVIAAKRNEEIINARGMLKNLVVGIIVMFAIATVCPLLINGLSAWVTW